MPAMWSWFTFVRALFVVRMRTVVIVVSTLIVAQFVVFEVASAQGDCCIVRGNIDCDPDEQIDINDLTRLVDYMFVSNDPLCCPEAANCDGDPEGIIGILDLTRLVDYMFVTYEPVESCGQAELTFDQREVLFNALDSVSSFLAGDPSDSAAIHLVAFLNNQPEIDSAGIVDSSSVWAWFTDDRLLLIPNNRPSTGTGLSTVDWPESSLDPVIPADFVLPERRFTDQEVTTKLYDVPADKAVDNPELPHSIQARVISTLGTGCFTIGAPVVKQLLEDNGYVTVPSTGSVPALLNVKGDGVFYMDAHGGMGVNRAGNKFLSIWTATPHSQTNDSIFASLLTNNELVYMYCDDRDPSTGTCAPHYRYAFTAKFVAQYMSFVPNSLIILNACQTDSLPALRQGFATAGASVFAGWSKTVTDVPANKACEFLIDRMLGANSSTLTPKEEPAQRSFGVDKIWLDMKNRGFDTDPDNQAKFRVSHLNANFGLLAPSIRYMFVIENTDSFFVTGVFGSDPGSDGRVLVDGIELPILDWQPELITAFIPNTGAGSAGPVIVEVDGIVGPTYSVKRKSNVVNLTEWRNQITYTTEDAGTLSGSIVINSHLRQDIHTFREEPHEAPIHYSTTFFAADDSYGTVSTSGEFSYTYQDHDPVDTDTWTWAGNDFVKQFGDSYPNQYLLTGKMLFPTNQLELSFMAFVYSGVFETLINSEDGFRYTAPIPMSTIVELYNVFPIIHMDMSNSWDIQAGQRIAVTCCSHDPDNNIGIKDITHTLTWPTSTANFPPDTTAAQ